MPQATRSQPARTLNSLVIISYRAKQLHCREPLKSKKLTTAIMNIGFLESAISPFKERSRRRKVFPSIDARTNDSAEIQTMAFYTPTQSLSAPSKSIPIAKSLKRTPSELQLMEDEARADFRDYCMYTRIVNGINSRDSAEAVNSIIRTRHLPIRETSSSYQEDFIKYAILPLEAAGRLSYQYPNENQQSMITDPEDEESSSPQEDGIFAMDL
jgi:hypothetical protein